MYDIVIEYDIVTAGGGGGGGQAANIMEALEVGAKVLLGDADTAAAKRNTKTETK